MIHVSIATSRFRSLKPRPLPLPAQTRGSNRNRAKQISRAPMVPAPFDQEGATEILNPAAASPIRSSARTRIRPMRNDVNAIGEGTENRKVSSSARIQHTSNNNTCVSSSNMTNPPYEYDSPSNARFLVLRALDTLNSAAARALSIRDSPSRGDLFISKSDRSRTFGSGEKGKRVTDSRLQARAALLQVRASRARGARSRACRACPWVGGSADSG